MLWRKKYSGSTTGLKSANSNLAVGSSLTEDLARSRKKCEKLPESAEDRAWSQEGWTYHPLVITETVAFVYGPEDFVVNDARILRAVRTPGVEGTAVFGRTGKGWARLVVTITGEPEPIRIARASLPLEAQALSGDPPKAIRPRPKM